MTQTLTQLIAVDMFTDYSQVIHILIHILFTLHPLSLIDEFAQLRYYSGSSYSSLFYNHFYDDK